MLRKLMHAALITCLLYLTMLTGWSSESQTSSLFDLGKTSSRIMGLEY